MPLDQRENLVPQETCPRKSKEEAEQTLSAFNPSNPLVTEMYDCLNQHLDFERICMLEVNHCAQAYCALLVSS